MSAEPAPTQLVTIYSVIVKVRKRGILNDEYKWTADVLGEILLDLDEEVFVCGQILMVRTEVAEKLEDFMDDFLVYRYNSNRLN